MKKTKGFTLAEVLITLAIIGIVAAITLPSLLVNVNEKAWDAQKKALHARLAQAIGQMNTLGGYGTYTKGETDDETVDTAAESFILDALSKVYKINNVCGPDKLSSCGVPSKIATLGGEAEINFPTKMSELNPKLLNKNHVEDESVTIVDTKAAAFETVNGESVAVFYNPDCASDTTSSHVAQNKMCVNFVYDLNGAEGPNEVGKDVGFMTAFYNKNSSVTGAVPYYKDYMTTTVSYSPNKETVDASEACKSLSGDLRLPNRDEAASLYVNGPLINMGNSSDYYWTGSIISQGADGLAWYQHFDSGTRHRALRKNQGYIRCVYK